MVACLAGCAAAPEPQPGAGEPFTGPDGEPYFVRRLEERGGRVQVVDRQGQPAAEQRLAASRLRAGQYLLEQRDGTVQVHRPGGASTTYPLPRLLTRADGCVLLLPDGAQGGEDDVWAVLLGPDGAEVRRLIATSLKSSPANRDHVEACMFGPVILFHSWIDLGFMKMHGVHLASASDLEPLRPAGRVVVVDVGSASGPRDDGWRLSPPPVALGIADEAERQFEGFLTPEGPLTLPVACDRLQPWGDVDHQRGRARPRAWLARRAGRLVALLGPSFEVLRYGVVGAEPLEVTYSMTLRRPGLLVELAQDQWEVLWADGTSSTRTAGRAEALEVASREATQAFEEPIRARARAAAAAKRAGEERARLVQELGAGLRRRVAAASAELQAGRAAAARAALKEIDHSIMLEVDRRLWYEALLSWAEALGGYEGLELLGRIEQDREFTDVVARTTLANARMKLHEALGTPPPGTARSGVAEPPDRPSWSSPPPTAPPQTQGELLRAFYYANQAPGQTPFRP